MEHTMTRTILATAVFLAAVAGCQSKLNIDQTVQIESGAMKTIEIDAPRYDQKMVFAIQSDNPVNVFVYLQKDKTAVMDAIDKGKKPEGLLASKENVTNETLEVSVPAKQPATIAFQTMTKTAVVKLKITGK
jgi:hypothetical protein